jgi:hypothetical protein
MTSERRPGSRSLRSARGFERAREAGSAQPSQRQRTQYTCEFSRGAESVYPGVEIDPYFAVSYHSCPVRAAYYCLFREVFCRSGPECAV